MIRTILLTARVCLLLLVNDARAAEALQVIVTGHGSPELARKLRAEVSYAGFLVSDDVSAARETTNSPDLSAAAKLSVLSADRVMLEFSRPEGDTVEQRVLASLPGEGDSFALRVVELLRARLVHLGWQLPDDADTGPLPIGTAKTDLPDIDERQHTRTPDKVTAPQAFDSLTVWLAGGATVSTAVGGLDVMPHVQFILRAEVASAWGVSLGAFQPLAFAEVEGEEGEAQVAWHAVTAAAYASLPLRPPWFAQAGAGAGLFLLDVRGEASEGYTAHRDEFATGLGYVELGVGAYLWERLRLRASATSGVTAPRPVVRFDEREVATLGRLYGSVGLSLEVGLGGPTTPP